jgi:hypothetical protein
MTAIGGVGFPTRQPCSRIDVRMDWNFFNTPTGIAVIAAAGTEHMSKSSLVGIYANGSGRDLPSRGRRSLDCNGLDEEREPLVATNREFQDGVVQRAWVNDAPIGLVENFNGLIFPV